GNTSNWIDCTVDNYPANQLGFISFGNGVGNVMVQNLTLLNCYGAMSTDAPATDLIKGGFIQNGQWQIYGSNITIDGMHVRGDAAQISLYGNNDVVQNSVFDQTSQDGAVRVRQGGGGNNSTIRFNTFDMISYSGGAIHIDNNTTGTNIYGNVM